MDKIDYHRAYKDKQGKLIPYEKVSKKVFMKDLESFGMSKKGVGDVMKEMEKPFSEKYPQAFNKKKSKKK